MFTRQAIFQKNFYNSPLIYSMIRNLQHASEIEVNIPDVKLPKARGKGPPRAPFAKNLFAGIFDTQMLTYPEAQTSERNRKFYEWIKPIEDYVSNLTNEGEKINRSNNEILQDLEDLNVFKAKIPELYEGTGLLETEVAKLLETLSCVPWLATYFVKKNIIGTDIICKYGTESQKVNYLSKIGSRELVPTICITEADSGPNIKFIGTKAILSTCQNYWILNGQKTFVPCGNNDSHLYLVFAHCSTDNERSTVEKDLSLFLVTEDFGGITCDNRYETLGQENVPLSNITFKDTKIPMENMIGKVGSATDPLIDIFKPGNRNIAPQAIGLLRHFTNLLTRHVLQRKHQDKNMFEFEGVQKVMIKITYELFTMESALYLITAIDDLYENQDLMLEKAMVENYCANACVSNIYEGLKIIGAHSYMESSPFMRLYKDALALTLFDSYEMDAKIYVALLGAQHAGKLLYDIINKERNITTYPLYHLKQLFWFKEKVPDLDLQGFLHPSFYLPARRLEVCLHKLKKLSITLLSRHGKEITERHSDLYKLSEIATSIFVLTATLSRASRSYCIGHKYADYDRCLATTFSLYTLNKIKWLETIADILPENTLESMYTEIAGNMFLQKGYINAHPIKRNYF